MRLRDRSGEDYQLLAELGSGGQARAHKARRMADNAEVVIKVFHRTPVGQERSEHIRRLETVIRHGREISAELPEILVCFPTGIIDDQGGFGVVMPCAAGREMTHDHWFLPPDDQTPQFTGKAIYAIHQGAFQYRNLILAGFHLARAIDRLHRKGMAHSDLSLGNVFIDPDSGKVSIIDCDNLACEGYLAHQVHGTPGFIAPEILPGKNGATVGAMTDRFSLAVVLFYLLALRHPFVGNQGDDWSPAYKDQEDSYGSRAVFTDHPTNLRNRYAGNHPHIRFGSLPEKLKGMFLDAFVNGLNDPARRPTSLAWAQELWKAFEETLRCSGCGQRYFATSPGVECTFCHKKHSGPCFRLHSSTGRRMLAEPGRKIRPHHAALGREFDFSEDLCEFQMRPKADGTNDLIMRNFNAPVLEMVANGRRQGCKPGKGFYLKGVESITVGDITYKVEPF